MKLYCLYNPSYEPLELMNENEQKVNRRRSSKSSISCPGTLKCEIPKGDEIEQIRVFAKDLKNGTKVEVSAEAAGKHIFSSSLTYSKQSCQVEESKLKSFSAKKANLSITANIIVDKEGAVMKENEPGHADNNKTQRRKSKENRLSLCKEESKSERTKLQGKENKIDKTKNTLLKPVDQNMPSSLCKAELDSPKKSGKFTKVASKDIDCIKSNESMKSGSLAKLISQSSEQVEERKLPRQPKKKVKSDIKTKDIGSYFKASTPKESDHLPAEDVSKSHTDLSSPINGQEAIDASKSEPSTNGFKDKFSMTETDVLDLKLKNETTPTENPVPTSHTPTNPRKRRAGDMVTPSTPNTTPGPRARRARVAMKALDSSSSATPSSKYKAVVEKAAVTSDPQDSPASDNKGLTARCVDFTPRGPWPSERWGHSLTLVAPDQAVLVGGQSSKQLSRDAVWTLNPETRSWKSNEVTTEGAKPEYRMGHTATYDPTMRCIYIFGGSKNTKWFHDVHVFDLDENKWSLVKCDGKAPTRAYHTTTLFRHELWIIGGVFPRPDPQPDGCDNDVHIFSPIMESWYKPIVTGDKPKPRSGHSSTLIDDILVVFGGWDFPFCFSDLHLLDLTTLDWSAPAVSGTAPKPRSWHAAVELSQKRILIHGGYDGDLALHDAHIFDLRAKSWTGLTLDPAPVRPRAGHSAIMLTSTYDEEKEDEVLVFGGGDNDGAYFDEMLSLYVPVPDVVDLMSF